MIEIVLVLSTSMEVFRPDFILAISAFSEVFYLLSCSPTKKSSAISFILCGFCKKWQGFWIENFQSRSTHLRQFLHTTHLSTVTTVVLRFQRHKPPLILIPNAWRVGCTHQQVDLFHRQVQAHLSPLLFTAFDVVGFWLRAALIVGERSPEASAWFTRASHGDSHPSAPIFLCWFQLSMLFSGLFCFSDFYCCISLLYCYTDLSCSLCNSYEIGVGVLRTPLTPSITTFWWWFLAYVRRNLWPASSEALSPCTFVLRFIFMYLLFFSMSFGLPNPIFM
jgi:hypothetical protein